MLGRKACNYPQVGDCQRYGEVKQRQIGVRLVNLVLNGVYVVASPYAIEILI
jgi:hypothetical protein